MAYNSDKYKKIFEDRYGKGSYDAGLSSAREIGRLKTQGEFAKTKYIAAMKKSQKEAEKRAEEEELYGGQSKKSYDAKLKEIGKITEKQEKAQKQGRGGHMPDEKQIKKERDIQAEYKRTGVFPSNIQKMLDNLDFSEADKKNAEYNAQLKKDKEKKKEETSLIDFIANLGKDNDSKSKKKKNSVWDDIATPLKNFGKGVGYMFDGDKKTNMYTAMDENIKDAANTERSTITKESGRALSRIANTGTLGALKEGSKRLTGEDNQAFKKRENESTAGKVADFAYDAAGYLIPGLGAYGAVRGAGLGVKAGSKGLQKAGQLAKEGAIVGAGLSTGEVGIREAINPQDYNWKDNAALIGIGTAAGAIADPALYGAGKALQAGIGKTLKGNVPEYTGKPSESTLNKLAPQPTARNEFQSDDLYNRLSAIRKPEQPTQMINETAASQAPSTPRQYENISAGSGRDPGLRLINPDIEGPNAIPVDLDNPASLVRQQIDTTSQAPKKKTSFDKIMTAVVDDLRPLDKAVRDLGGKNIPANKNPYIKARLARGVAGKAETYLKGGIYSTDGQKVGASLEEIIKPFENSMDTFLPYLTAKRALDYDAKGLTAGIKPKSLENVSDRQLADATIKQLETPEFAGAQQELVKYSRSLLNELKESGYYTDEAIEQIFKENPNYVPMNRVQDPSVRGFKPLSASNKLASLANPTKKRTGSQKQIVNPIESMIKNTYIINNIAERNKVGVSLLELIETAPENNMWGRVIGKGKQDNSIDGLSSVLDEATVQSNDGRADAIDNLFKGEGNKVYVYRNGEKVEMELQEDLYKAMLTLDNNQIHPFLKIISHPTSWLRQGAVLSPDFGPVNIFRDQFSAFVNSKYGFIPFVDMFNGMGNVLKKDDVYWKWKNAGGANSILATLDREYLQKDIRSMIKRPMTQKIKDFSKKPISNTINAGLTPLRKISEITEESTRLGEFKKGLKKGASTEEAAFYSRDLIDFNRAGNLGRHYNQITAFFNAAVQSLDKTARTFKSNPVGATVRATQLITLPSIVAYMYNKDEEWYQDLPQRDKDLYWHFKTGDTIVKLPKPFEIGVMFGTVPERVLDFLQTNDPEAFKELDVTIRNAFTPPWLPTAFAPWIEIARNSNSFNKAPIVPRREEGLLPEDQYGPYQSELSKRLGSAIGKSPRQIEHAFRGYTGGLGGYFLQGTDAIAQASGVEKAPKPDRGVADLPIVNRFIVKNLEGNNQSVNDFYKMYDQLNRENKSAKKNKEINPNADVSRLFNQLQGNISDLQSQKREIIESKEMNGKEKTEKIKELDTLITRLAKNGLLKAKE
ncbi:LPD38 domain-containing protein [Metabacillus sp. cB07]|uniref:LPD38 domain-containing protein n=1 Tax=Metabacillus sp. cB07 TaxID=2806989 RepID=UPI00193A6213|nr:LPD38 domain-containing protein [Metabacillus sp. cB07]